MRTCVVLPCISAQPKHKQSLMSGQSWRACLLNRKCGWDGAGYDIRTPEKFENVMKQFDSIVGYKFLRGMHLNDSKSELSSGLDR